MSTNAGTTQKSPAGAAPLRASDVPALVLGSGITALGVIRGLGRMGVRTYCASRELGYVAASRWCKRTSVCLDRYAELAPFLAQLPYERAAVFACSDDWVLAMAALEGALAERFPISQAPPASVKICLDKGLLAATLREHNIPHPHTALIQSEQDLADICAEHIGEYFLKPRDSQAFSARYRVKAFHVTTAAEAQARYHQIAQDGLEVMLQEYIPGPPTNHYFIDGFVDRGGRVCARFARQRIRMYPLRFGNSSFMTSVPPAEVAPATQLLDQLLGVLHYRGIFSAEFKLDPRDQTFKLLEMNVRPWWYVEFAELCGVEICRMAYRDALGLDTGTTMTYQTGASCVFPCLDLSTSLRLFRQGELSFWSWLQSWLRARQALFQWNDPLPSLAFLAGQIREKLTRWFSVKG